jgi:hypothetical protein
VPRRRPLIVALLVLVLTGCGGAGKPSGPSPDAEALAYVPTSAPLAVVVSTDTSKGQGAALRSLAERVPGADIGLSELAGRLGLDFDRDVRPALGHDVVLSFTDRAAAQRHQLLLSAVAGSRSLLEHAVAAHVADRSWRAAGSYRGARLYRSLQAVANHRAVAAVRGSVLLLSDNGAVLRRALDLRAQRAGLTPATLRERIGNLPPDALVRVVGDARTLLSGRRAERARQIPWVRALRQFAATVQVTGGGLRARFRLSTDPTGLTAADVPLATGLQSPNPAGEAPLVAGIRDASHLLAFAERAGPVLAPDKLGGLGAGKVFLRLLGVDLDQDVVGQFPATTTVLSDLRHFTVRADVRDPAGLQHALDRVKPLTARLLAGAGLSGVDIDEQAGGVYRVRRAGRTIARYAVVGRVFLVTTDPAANLARIAAARPAGATTTERRGALTIRLQGSALQDLVVRLLRLPPIAKLALAQLGGATAAVRAELDRVEGAIDVLISG